MTQLNKDRGSYHQYLTSHYCHDYTILMSIFLFTTYKSAWQICRISSLPNCHFSQRRGRIPKNLEKRTYLILGRDWRKVFKFNGTKLCLMFPIFILIAEESNFHQRMLIMGLVWKQLVHLGNNEEMIIKQRGDYSLYLNLKRKVAIKLVEIFWYNFWHKRTNNRKK